jgi:hypothetical protein
VDVLVSHSAGSFLGFALFIILILFCRVDVLVSHSAESFLWFALFIILVLFCRVDVLVSHSAGSFLGFRAAAEIDRIISAAFLNFIGGKPHRYIL